MNRKSRLATSGGFLSGRQVVALVTALVLGVLLYPLGARAAGQLVTVVDSTTNNQARVIDGVLQTGSYPIRAARPVQAVVHCGYYMASFGCPPYRHQLFGPFPATTKLMLTSVTAESYYYNSYLEVDLWAGNPDTAGDCSATSANQKLVLPMVTGPETTAHLDFPQPFQVQSPNQKNGKQWCVWTNNPNNTGNYMVVAVGYKV